MRIRFLSEQIYDQGAPGKGPKFSKGFVLDEKGVQEALSLSESPSQEWARGFLTRWLTRKVAEEVDNSVPVGEPKEESGGNDLEKMNVSDLKKHADDNKIDLGDATKKADIIAAIQLANEQK